MVTCTSGVCASLLLVAMLLLLLLLLLALLLFVVALMLAAGMMVVVAVATLITTTHRSSCHVSKISPRTQKKTSCTLPQNNHLTLSLFLSVGRRALISNDSRWWTFLALSHHLFHVFAPPPKIATENLITRAPQQTISQPEFHAKIVGCELSTFSVVVVAAATTTAATVCTVEDLGEDWWHWKLLWPVVPHPTDRTVPVWWWWVRSLVRAVNCKVTTKKNEIQWWKN